MRASASSVPEIQVSPPPISAGGPEIWMGGFVPAAIDRVAQLADGYLAFGADTIPEYLAACERQGRVPEERQLNRTYWAIIDEDPERAYAGAGPHFIHMYNDYIRRDAYPDLEVFDDPADGARARPRGRCAAGDDADGAIEAINRDIALGARDIEPARVHAGRGRRRGVRAAAIHLRQGDPERRRGGESWAQTERGMDAGSAGLEAGARRLA